MQTRAVAAVREWNAELGADGRPGWPARHGDVIKAIVADALGLHLDQFQRIVVDPCSVTVIRYTELRPFVRPAQRHRRRRRRTSPPPKKNRGAAREGAHGERRRGAAAEPA